MTPNQLRAHYEHNSEDGWPTFSPEIHEHLLANLETGAIRAAEPLPDGTWQVNTWVKTAILLAFRRTPVAPMPFAGLHFLDKPSFPPRAFHLADRVRLVPGGTSVRRGAHLSPGVVVMPPAFINVGAFVGADTMIDSHALVGSCAQIGSRVHLSAGAQIGGVLEPASARPVIIEDDAFIGGLSAVFEGVRVRSRAVLAAGVVLTASTRIFDLVHSTEHRLEIPEGAVVVPGSRPASGPFASANALSLSAPMIVKYRDSKTDASTALEQALR